jgi:hypothetical protein
MHVIERMTQKIRPGKWEEAAALERAWDAVEVKQGNVPKKRRYLSAYSGQPMGMFVWEREWDSMSALEQHWQRADPPKLVKEIKALTARSDAVFEYIRMELYVPFDDMFQ